jgi:hypothetical protein
VMGCFGSKRVTEATDVLWIPGMGHVMLCGSENSHQ